jgi:hypothetical protein
MRSFFVFFKSLPLCLGSVVMCAFQYTSYIEKTPRIEGSSSLSFSISMSITRKDLTNLLMCRLLTLRRGTVDWPQWTAARMRSSPEDLLKACARAFRSLD